VNKKIMIFLMFCFLNLMAQDNKIKKIEYIAIDKNDLVAIQKSLVKLIDNYKKIDNQIYKNSQEIEKLQIIIDNIKKSNKKPATKINLIKKAFITVYRGNIRKAPTTKSPILGTFKKGDTVLIDKIIENKQTKTLWYKLHNQDAYISSKIATILYEINKKDRK